MFDNFIAERAAQRTAAQQQRKAAPTLATLAADVARVQAQPGNAGVRVFADDHTLHTVTCLEPTPYFAGQQTDEDIPTMEARRAAWIAELPSLPFVARIKREQEIRELERRLVKARRLDEAGRRDAERVQERVGERRLA